MWMLVSFTGQIDATENADMFACAQQDPEYWTVLTDSAQNQSTSKGQETRQPNSTLNCPEDSMMASRVGAETFDGKKSNRCTNFDRGSRCFDLFRASDTCDQGVINLRLHEVVDTLTSPSEVCAVRYFNRMAPDTVYTARLRNSRAENFPCTNQILIKDVTL